MGAGIGTAERLEVAGLTVSYGRTVALRAVDLVARPGEVVGVAGPNGAGKSTLLKASSVSSCRTAAG